MLRVVGGCAFERHAEILGSRNAAHQVVFGGEHVLAPEHGTHDGSVAARVWGPVHGAHPAGCRGAGGAADNKIGARAGNGDQAGEALEEGRATGEAEAQPRAGGGVHGRALAVVVKKGHPAVQSHQDMGDVAAAAGAGVRDAQDRRRAGDGRHAHVFGAGPGQPLPRLGLDARPAGVLRNLDVGGHGVCLLIVVVNAFVFFLIF